MTGRGSDSAPIRRGGLAEHATRLAGKRGIVQVSEWRALSFALLAHLVLFFLLFFGVSWKTTDRCKNGVPAPLSYFERMLNDVREVFGWPPKLPPDCMVRVEMWSPPAARNPTLTPRPALPPVPVEASAPAQPREPVTAPEPIVQAAKTEPVKVAPAKTLPVPAAEPKPIVKPDLAIERAKAEREKAERAKTERDKAEREKVERAKAEREKAEREKVERAKAEREKVERAKTERDKAEREKLERAKTERDKAEREKLERAKAEQERLEREKAEQRERDRREKEMQDKKRDKDQALSQARARIEMRNQEIRPSLAPAESNKEANPASRPTSAPPAPTSLGAPASTNPTAAQSGGAGGGSAAENAGRIKDWSARVSALIRIHTFLPPLEGNPEVEFRVNLRPDCSVVSVQKIKSSSVPAWDQAAEAGIKKTERFPAFPGGSCPSSVALSHRPKD
jgi:colicin import membrane protein